MDQQTLIMVAVGAAILLIAALVIVRASRHARSRSLRDKFGPEYDREVGAAGRKKAERELIERKQRVEQLDIRPLSLAERDRFRKEWETIQARFIDRPQTAVVEADELISEIMTTRGYKVADFDERAAELSVMYPNLVENYRAAHSVTTAHERGVSSTEDLRQAMVRYRMLFDQLISEVDRERDERRPSPVEIDEFESRDRRVGDIRTRDERIRDERLRDERARAASEREEDDEHRRRF